ncbi:hypothetical protein GWI33_003783 [Rhynchophorus ferrugineus]|uniref:Uncharacterized protein n=1 Tax=Rhynchophorus ferrugineus TaxID=354439 RepID=A0A834HLZ8_RHYFE|nr:hypothetical protein GWI33_003783 [Rhynchophorus ferrugineus]
MFDAQETTDPARKSLPKTVSKTGQFPRKARQTRGPGDLLRPLSVFNGATVSFVPVPLRDPFEIDQKEVAREFLPVLRSLFLGLTICWFWLVLWLRPSRGRCLRCGVVVDRPFRRLVIFRRSYGGAIKSCSA